VSKKPVVQRGVQDSLLAERQLLSEVDHPFILKLVQTFRNDAFVYFLCELVTGGELLNVLQVLGLLNIHQARFYTGSIMLALEYLHNRRIAFLDLKGENVMVDHQGYIKLVDFGIATKIMALSYVVKGTPHFMCPEMILSKGYDTSADLWALGICLYDFMCGKLPYGHECNNNAQVLRSILKDPLVFPDWFPATECAPEAMALIGALLSRDPWLRPGAGVRGYASLKGDPFFNGFNFEDLQGHQLQRALPRSSQARELSRCSGPAARMQVWKRSSRLGLSLHNKL
jgi:cGMP-dependent protein kinase